MTDIVFLALTIMGGMIWPQSVPRGEERGQTFKTDKWRHALKQIRRMNSVLSKCMLFRDDDAEHSLATEQ